MAAGWSARLVLAACVTAVSFGALELGVRAVGRTDEDGNFALGRRQALPARLPIKRLEAAVRTYRQSTETLFRDDARLGWVPRPLAGNDLYAYDEGGLRARPGGEGPSRPAGARWRIAIFGDSFAHGSEVGFDESWGARVERALDRRERPVEVLNFGVPGYGMDQAFLRWQEQGRAYRPDVVVFGVQVENAGRNLNLLRVLYDSADLPFAKPRFVESDGALELVNVPVPAPEQVLQILQSLEKWPLLPHERYYQRDRFDARLWRRSRLAGLVEGMVRGTDRGQPAGELPEEQQRLAIRIVERFAGSVRSAGGEFVMVHFPRRVDLEQARRHGQMPNAGLLEALSGIAPVVRVERALLERAGDGDLGPLFMPGGHYSPDGYALLAAEVAAHLAARGPAPAARHGAAIGMH